MWVNGICPFIDNYKNGEWMQHYMCGRIPANEQKIEMIQEEVVTRSEDGIERHIISETAIYDNPRDPEEAGRYQA